MKEASFMTLESISKYKRIHMIGIGGVSMSGLAEHISHFGFSVTGSDAKESENTKHLQSLGVNVQIGHHPEMVSLADLVVYTAAIPKDDPEFLEAERLGKEMMERSTFLGEITKCYPECICISGTHGKTTTTSMIATCFLEAHLDPTIEVGAYLKKIDGNNRTGNSEYFILEACEYVDSFLEFSPSTAIILNIDNDHLDYFKTLDNVKHSFWQFTERLKNNGIVIANLDDANTKDVISKTEHQVIGYGIENENATFSAKEITLNSYGTPTFSVFKNKEFYDTYTLQVHGKHNILNALATIATCDLYGIEKSFIKQGLTSFTGANRRFEKIGEYKGIPVYDDYAHHPTEIKTTLSCSKEIPHNKTWAIFEPHTYSRTKEHLEAFASILKEFDFVLLADIYAAREINTYSVSSKDLERLIKKENKNCFYFENYEGIVAYLKEHVQMGDIIVTIGAGTINQIGYQMIEKEKATLSF